MKFIIAGYTAAPTDATAAATYYDKLLRIAPADGLEFAWSGPQTPTQLDPVLRQLPAGWSITLNDIPATYRACVNNPKFGLASPDDAGRAEALGMLREIVTAIKTMNDRVGRQVVLAVEIHSAPGFDQRVLMPDAGAFQRSLEEAATYDWGDCAVIVEHCDAFVAHQKPAKGFLSLTEEMRVLSRLAGSPIGLGLNWGRSMIELRDADRVIDHVIEASGSGLLKAFTFSGTAAIKNVYGDAWLDSHLPFADTIDPDFAEPASGMTMAHAAQVLDHVEHCSFLAIKTNWPAARTDPLERAASVEANFHALASVLRANRRIAGKLRLQA